MALMRLNGFNDLFREMNRFQEEFNRNIARNSGGWPNVGPAVNVWADEQAVFVEADLPGVDPAKIDISVTEGNRLTIQGERPEVDLENAVWHRQERGHGNFVREFTLPTLVDADKVEARYDAGVLRLTLPKAAAAKPRKITVRS
ncbi:MAG TPA: Hsp20/alpha crystallin family protein [Gemmataceae bacterium]|jgi:HSP20 family protein|nr:Hsp20/alpha crystallin family protein [Gemmataceae bacterium]